MPNCAIVECKNHSRKTSGRDIKYYRFPRNENLSQQWIQACRRVDKLNLNNVNIDNNITFLARICSIHFSPNSFQISLRNQLMNYAPSNYRALKDDAVPTENLPTSNSVISNGKFENGIRQLNKRSNQSEYRREIIIELFKEPVAMVDFVQSAAELNTKVEPQEVVQGPPININELLQETSF